MTIRIMTWNINSIRLRLKMLEKLVLDYKPDILCLQELKCDLANFPELGLRLMGFEYQANHCQKAYNGVSIASKIALQNITKSLFCGNKDARHIKATIDTGTKIVDLHNFYVPAGGYEADVKISEKYRHKLKFLDEMQDFFAKREPCSANESILLGDLNVAPYENDVWSHKQMLNTVSHTSAEITRLSKVLSAGNFVDIARNRHKSDEKLYSWWSYRAKDWMKSDRGRRLDHIWTTGTLAKQVKDFQILKILRSSHKPSDHVPVFVDFDL